MQRKKLQRTTRKLVFLFSFLESKVFRCCVQAIFISAVIPCSFLKPSTSRSEGDLAISRTIVSKVNGIGGDFARWYEKSDLIAFCALECDPRLDRFRRLMYWKLSA